MNVEASAPNLLELTGDIVAAHVANNNVPAADLPKLITTVHEALATLGNEAAKEPGVPFPLKPAVSIRASIKPDHLICLEDGAKVKMLKRYIYRRYGLTPAEYRTKWNLPADYPMVAPIYAQMRSELAKSFGLGRKKSEPPATVPVAPKRGRKPKADA